MPRLWIADDKLRYLEFVKSSQWATESDVESGSPTFPSLWGFLERLATTHQETFGRTRMDISALFEHTLLHELIHSDKVGTPQYEIPEAESYGWDKCIEAKSATNSGMAPFRIMYSYVMLIVAQTPLHSSRLVASS